MVRLRSPSADRVLGIDDDETELVLDALSTASARRILTALNDSPATAPELADSTGLTAQNVSYHLGKLVDAELVRLDGERGTDGNAATVYAPAKRTVVSTESDVTFTRPGIGALGIAVGVLLTLACMHSLVDPSAALFATVDHGLGHLLSFV
jgi:DNA-binding transcriptional ArsR family regulator